MSDAVVRHGQTSEDRAPSAEALALVRTKRAERAARSRRGARAAYLTAALCAVGLVVVWLFDLSTKNPTPARLLGVGIVTFALVGFVLSFLTWVRATGGGRDVEAETEAEAEAETDLSAAADSRGTGRDAPTRDTSAAAGTPAATGPESVTPHAAPDSADAAEPLDDAALYGPQDLDAD